MLLQKTTFSLVNSKVHPSDVIHEKVEFYVVFFFFSNLPTNHHGTSPTPLYLKVILTKNNCTKMTSHLNELVA